MQIYCLSNKGTAPYVHMQQKKRRNGHLYIQEIDDWTWNLTRSTCISGEVLYHLAIKANDQGQQNPYFYCICYDTVTASLQLLVGKKLVGLPGSYCSVHVKKLQIMVHKIDCGYWPGYMQLCNTELLHEFICDIMLMSWV